MLIYVDLKILPWRIFSAIRSSAQCRWACWSCRYSLLSSSSRVKGFGHSAPHFLLLSSSCKGIGPRLLNAFGLKDGGGESRL